MNEEYRMMRQEADEWRDALVIEVDAREKAEAAMEQMLDIMAAYCAERMTDERRPD